MNDKLVMVDKTALGELRADLRAAIRTAQQDDSLQTAWLTIGATANTLDALLTEIIDQ